MIQTPDILKGYFETGDHPTQAQFRDLIDTIAATNLKTIVYTVGVAGVTGVNHNFTSVANMTEQSIQLGGTTIIPAKSPILSIAVHCITGLSGIIAGTSDIGYTSGGNEYLGAGNIDDTNEIIITSPLIGSPGILLETSSVYFSFTPNANWNTITTGKWKIFISLLDNSSL